MLNDLIEPLRSNVTKVGDPKAEVWLARYGDRKFERDFLLRESEIYCNLIKDIEMTLKVVK